ncbi:hypothetical protein [Glycomyces xiaoerkulensis]|uniref:hypothetical protein n=1 Tax=Glycomyces xiaoerkulensis TaxID=2038139 RepID=UPI000C2699D6|nr:hypothetical protein [Glycomyces xiaoerkulensis]
MSDPHRRSGRNRDYGSIPVERAYEVSRYAMPVAGRCANFAIVFNAMITGFIGVMGLQVSGSEAAADYEGPAASDVDPQVLQPLSVVQLVLAAASIWIVFRIIRQRRIALFTAFVVTGFITLIDVALLVLVKARISGFDDYDLQFQEAAEFIPLALNGLVYLLLCIPSLWEWCDE